MIRWTAALLALLLLHVSPSAAAVVADLTLSLRYWNTDSLNTTQFGYIRLLADVDLMAGTRFHLDIDQEETGLELYEAFGELGRGKRRGRLGQYEIPFGNHNRTELYYTGLINQPLIRYYPSRDPSIGQSAEGIAYLGSMSSWQVEAALFGERESLESTVPPGGHGAIRVQHFGGSLILGASVLSVRIPDQDAQYRGTGHFYGLDFRFSHPAMVLRGELVAGDVPDGSPEGFYVDILYHPEWLGRVSFVGRTEAVQGQPRNGSTLRQQTIGFKWQLIRSTTLALNQVFDSPRGRYSLQGTALFLWQTHRL
jgi:hypothetical protein